MKRLLALLLFAAASPAAAQGSDEPRFCPNNPSLEASACVTQPGRVHVEVTALDWQLERDAGQRIDTILAAETLVRVGIGPATEFQFEWTPYGRVRTRDRASGSIERTGRVGDIRLAVRQNLRNPDGSGLSWGVEPFVTLPVGREPVGDGDWSAGVVVPLTYDLTDTINIGATGEIDAAADEDGHGRHFAGNLVAAAAFALTDALNLTTETQLLRDEDPSGATTQWLGGLGVTWKVAPTRAFYAEAVTGLDHDASDFRLYAGLAALF